MHTVKLFDLCAGATKSQNPLLSPLSYVEAVTFVFACLHLLLHVDFALQLLAHMMAYMSHADPKSKRTSQMFAFLEAAMQSV